MGWIAAALSGIFAAFTYPTVFAGFRFPELGFLAFFAWIPLFLSLRGAGPGRAFGGAFVASLFHYSIGMYWIYTAMNSFGGLSPVLTVMSLAILFAVLSAYFAVIFAISAWIARFTGWRMMWVRPLVWVGIEYLRGHLPAGGFPWSQVGYSQGGFLHFIQIADLFGIYGVTWLVVFINESLSEFIVAWRRDRKKGAWKSLAPALLLFLFALGYGRYQLVRDHVEPIQTLKVGIVQANIPQGDKWRGDAIQKIMDIFQNGTMSLESEGASLVIWPEASLPMEIAYDSEKVPHDLGQSRADVLFGAVTRSAKPGPNEDEEPYYNTVMLADGTGKILGHYHKRHLVPFGEYVPWQEYLSFARKMTAQVGQMLPGKEYHNLEYRGRQLGVLICYEDIFPEISRIMTAKGAQVLVNPTNDAWYGDSSAAYQHQVFSQFRAVETRRAVIRAANTGISSQIDRQGRIQWQGGLFTREAFMSSLPFYDDKTLYVRIGDALPIGALAMIGMVFLTAGYRRFRKVG